MFAERLSEVEPVARNELNKLTLINTMKHELHHQQIDLIAHKQRVIQVHVGGFEIERVPIAVAKGAIEFDFASIDQYIDRQALMLKNAEERKIHTHYPMGCHCSGNARRHFK